MIKKAFNELNSVEHYVIHQLSGINLNQSQPTATGEQLARETGPGYGFHWTYQSAKEIERGVNEALVESELRKALIRINLDIAKQPERADEVIYKLRAILISVNHTGLVRANEEFAKWLCGEKTMPFGPNNRHVPVRLVDFDHLENNTFIITNQYWLHYRETKIPDIVLLINGIPIVVGEAKTPIRPSISWLDCAHDIHNIYEDAISQLFVPTLFSFATEGKELFYGPVRCSLEKWSPWRLEADDDLVKMMGLDEVVKELTHLLHPKRLLDILQNFALFTSDKKKRRIKVVCRYQQYDGANKIIERVRDGRLKKG